MRKWLVVAPLVSGCSADPFDGHPCGERASAPWDGGDYTCAICGPTSRGGTYGFCAPDGGVIECVYVCRGRAPAGLAGLSTMHDTFGSYLAVSAEMEAAAVHAFWQLADELEAHGIPGDAAREAALDEQRHARDTTRLALKHGHLPALPRVRPLPEPRSLDAIAMDNAIEGLGRELFGATANAWQAEHASDPEVRALMRTIAPDELAHARFSAELDATLRRRISRAVRRQLRDAQEQALLTFAANEANEPLRERLGLMDPDQALSTARRLLERA